jgi:hypothetical protein
MPTDPPDTGPDNPHGDVRLARVLAARAAVEGGFSGLARAISLANPDRKKQIERDMAKRRERDPGDTPAKDPEVIDRRKLNGLVTGKTDTVFSISELRCIDRYLQRYGEGLAYRPLFERPDLMQALADCGRVTFLLGSKRDSTYESGSLFSAWDVLALGELQRGLSALGRSVEIDIQEVPFDWSAGAPQTGAQEKWSRFLYERDRAVVCIASSRTNAAFEVVMAEATGCSPYATTSLAHTLALPFAFAWSSELKGVYPSSFQLSADDIRGRAPEVAAMIDEGQASALVVGDQVLVDTVTPRKVGDTHGLVVAHRPKELGLRLCITGVTGPGTLCAAKIAGNLTMGIHETGAGRGSDVYFAVVRGSVPPGRAEDFLNLREFGEEVLIPPARWSRSGPRVEIPADRLLPERKS